MATIDGIAIPDSKLCREIAELVRDVETDLLFNHSARVYYFAALAGRRSRLDVDRELLYAAAMFHDLGLTPQHSSASERFEVDGANAAREFLKSRGVAPADMDLVWLAIALHTTQGIPAHMHPLVALVATGVKMDVVGIGYDEFSQAQREAVIGAFPRTAGFEEGLIDALYEGFRHKPDSTYGTVNADVMADRDPHFHRRDFCTAVRRSRWRSEAEGRGEAAGRVA